MTKHEEREQAHKDLDVAFRGGERARKAVTEVLRYVAGRVRRERRTKRLSKKSRGAA